MKSVLIIILLFISSYLVGQSGFTEIDNRSKEIPGKLVKVENIANYLTEGLNSDTEKVRAIYSWIAQNMEYDVSQLEGDVRYASSSTLIEEAIMNKKGVCQHYSDLFSALCNSIGIESHTVIGYVRGDSGEIMDFDHAWNGVKIDSGYYFMDATWGSGYVENYKFVKDFSDEYFLVKPEIFIETHMPFDPIWQFLNNPIDNRDFKNGDFSKVMAKGNFMFEDTIKQFKDLDIISKYEQSNRRIIKSGVNNDLIRERLQENNNHLAVARFNIAIDSLNHGINNFNLYLAHKKNKFQDPEIDDSEIQKILASAESRIHYAQSALALIKNTNLEFNESVIKTRNMIPNLIEDVKKEKEFLRTYLKTWKPFRFFTFDIYTELSL